MAIEGKLYYMRSPCKGEDPHARQEFPCAFTPGVEIADVPITKRAGREPRLAARANRKMVRPSFILGPAQEHGLARLASEVEMHLATNVEPRVGELGSIDDLTVECANDNSSQGQSDYLRQRSRHALGEVTHSSVQRFGR